MFMGLVSLHIPRVAQRVCRGSDPLRKRPLQPCARALGGEQEHHRIARKRGTSERYRRDGRLRIQTSAEDRIFEKRGRWEKFFSCPHAMLAKASNVHHVEPSREETLHPLCRGHMNTRSRGETWRMDKITAQNNGSVEDYIASLDEQTVKESQVLIEMMQRISGHEPKLWNVGTIGFDTYH